MSSGSNDIDEPILDNFISQQRGCLGYRFSLLFDDLVDRFQDGIAILCDWIHLPSSID